MLAHFNNVVQANQNQEPVYDNLFEVTFDFPTPLTAVNKNKDLITMQASSAKLDLTPDLKIIKQFFKYSGRAYVHTNAENSVREFELDFNLNVSNNFVMDSWNMLKQWYDLGWNSQTGELHYKSEMIGTIVAHVHDRKGIVIRRVEFRNVMLNKLSGMALAWSNGEIYSVEASFIADTWIDLYQNL